MIRARASANATRDVSMVIQRRPHCSATKAAVPEPHVGSRTRSPGSVAIKTQRSVTLVLVWTTYILGSPNPAVVVSSHWLVSEKTRKSSKKRTYLNVLPAANRRDAFLSRSIPSRFVFHPPFAGRY